MSLPDDVTPEPGPREGEEPDTLTRPLAESVRARVVEYGSDVLGALPESEVPSGLRRVARFEPRRRAKLAGPQIGAQLESDPAFRDRVADRMERVWPELVRKLREGLIPPAADPVVVAAVAYVIRPAGWPRIIERVHTELEHREAAREADASAETIASLRKQLEETRAEHRAELERMRSELRSSRSTIADLRRRVHAERERAKEALARAERAEREAAEADNAATSQASAYDAENRRLRNRLAAVEAQVETARRAARAGRSAEEARLRVLIDVLLDAAHGLRRELALPTTIDRPADLVTDQETGWGAGVPALGVPDDDPGLVDQLLNLPHMHLLVDGYNVTKTGYGTLPLADQRARLLAALEGLATRTKAEITCVFDGMDAETRTPALSSARRVRLLFSERGETADDLIIRLVRAEPAGRPLAVVSSDKEIIAAIRRAGARSVPTALFLRRLESGG